METRIVTKVEPVYPEAARKAGMQGLVVLDVVVAPDGSVKRLRPVSGPELLVQSAKEAAQSWKFEPYLSNGEAGEVATTLALEIRLNWRGATRIFQPAGRACHAGRLPTRSQRRPLPR